MEILLIRHTSVNIDKGICYGFSDIELNNNYKKEFILLKEKLQIQSDTVFYTSPLIRCKSLAEYLSKNNYNTDDRIKEMNFGKWELKEWNNIDNNELNHWIEDYINVKCPQGESFKDLYCRSVDFYLELIKKDLTSVILVTHGGVIKSIIAYILSIPLTKAPSISIDYGGISKVSIVTEFTNVEYINK